MQWLDQLPFADNRVVQIGFLLACGIAALIVLAIVYRFAFAHRLRVPGGRTRQPRLGLVDAFSLDGQRQLVLVRRDNVEHLVMIGGPNDVLVESQINRAMPSARESAPASPLLAPSTPARRTETAVAAAPVVAEAPPAKVAAPAPTAPAAPKAAPAAPAAPKATAPPPAAPRSPAPGGQATAIVKATAPAPAAKPIEPEPAARPAPAPSPSPPAQAAEQAPGAPPAPESSMSRPLPTRPAMPSPIVPAGASANRATVTRLTEKVPPRATPISGASPTPSPAAPSRLDKAGPVAAALAEPRAAPSALSVAAVGAGLAQASPAAKAPEGTGKIAEARPPADKANATSSVRPSANVDDPFADLNSLEAEMARLLGRERPS